MCSTGLKKHKKRENENLVVETKTIPCGKQEKPKDFEHLTLYIDRKVEPWKEKTWDDQYNIVGKCLVS